MSSMAFAMYQFTKGEGRLNTTQDLFTQAEYFAEEANRLYKIVRQFSYQVSICYIYLNEDVWLSWQMFDVRFVTGSSRNDEKRTVRTFR